MVVKVAEYSGTLNCKHCVIVPYTNTSNSNICCGEKLTTKNCASQTFHPQGDYESEQLWHKQFTRWWNWNWQRKRTSLLRKLGKKHFQSDDRKTTKDKSVECNFPKLPKNKQQKQEREIKNTIYSSSSKISRLHQPYTDYGPVKPIEEYLPIFAKCSSRKNQAYKSRKKRNKHQERVYEGWMREICSSDTESETDVFVKGRKSSEKNRMHYLSLRLRKLNSELFNEKSDENQPKSEKYHNKVSEFKSPISGKIYHLDLSKTQTLYVKPDETSYNSKSCTDKDLLAKPEFSCTKEYYQIRKEHIELLNSICEIVDKQTKNKSVKSDFDKKIEEVNIGLNETVVEVNPSIKDVKLNESFDLYSNMKTDRYVPNNSRSLPVFMEQYSAEVDILKNNYAFDLFSTFTKSEYDYDINYIYNNLDVFKSSITETSFIWDYIERQKINTRACKL